MGHSVTIPLDNTYLNALKDKIFIEFKKAIPELTIDELERNKIKLEQQNKKISELEEKNIRLNELEKRISMLEDTKPEKFT